MRVRSNAVRAGLAALSAALAPMAQAQIFGGPKPGEIGFLPPNTEKADGLFWFHNWILLPVITAISLPVLPLIVYIGWRFDAPKNPVPSRRTHHAPPELPWPV